MLSYSAIPDLRATPAFCHSHTLCRAHLDISQVTHEIEIVNSASYCPLRDIPRVLRNCPDKSIVGTQQTMSESVVTPPSPVHIHSRTGPRQKKVIVTAAFKHTQPLTYKVWEKDHPGHLSQGWDCKCKELTDVFCSLRLGNLTLKVRFLQRAGLF